MHKSARQFGALFLTTYGLPDEARVLDVGAMVVDSPDAEQLKTAGSLREFAGPSMRFVGADLAPGPGVDVVLPEPGILPFEDGSFDAVISTSCFEHDAAFWSTFAEMARVTVPGGFIYLNAPSNGAYHRYPLDCWRFYPDAGLGLAAWARRRGQEVTLLESFVGPRDEDQWNDCVMVFGRGDATPARRLSDQLHGLRNLHVPERSPDPIGFTPSTEDQELLLAARDRSWTEAPPAGGAIGWVDALGPQHAMGWVFSPDPAESAIVLARLNGAIIGTATANQARADLEQAGLGRSSFTMRLRVPVQPSDLRRSLQFEAMLHGESLGMVMPVPSLAVLDQPAAPLAAQALPGDPALESLLAPALEPLFWAAFRRGVPSAWYGHVPFAHWIVGALRPRVIVELGVHYGASYFAFCHAVLRYGYPAQCHGIDTWRGDAHAGFYDDSVFESVSAFNAAHCAGLSTLHRMEFDDALSGFADGSVDLLHIDGLHTYDAVRNDFELWRPKLSPRGVVLFHDIAVRHGDFGVWQLWEELVATSPSFSFQHEWGLGVLAVGAEPAPSIAALCRLRGTAGEGRIRDRFHWYGEHVKLTASVALEPV